MIGRKMVGSVETKRFKFTSWEEGKLTPFGTLQGCPLLRFLDKIPGGRHLHNAWPALLQASLAASMSSCTWVKSIQQLARVKGKVTLWVSCIMILPFLISSPLSPSGPQAINSF